MNFKNAFWDFPILEEKFSCNNAFNNKCTLKLPTNYLDNLSFWCSKIKIMNGTIFLLVGMVKDKFANFWIYSLLSPFESKDYAYTLSITHENGRSKFSHYNGQASYMFSRIFLIIPVLVQWDILLPDSDFTSIGFTKFIQMSHL